MEGHPPAVEHSNRSSHSSSRGGALSTLLMDRWVTVDPWQGLRSLKTATHEPIWLTAPEEPVPVLEWGTDSPDLPVLVLGRHPTVQLFLQEVLHIRVQVRAMAGVPLPLEGDGGSSSSCSSSSFRVSVI